MRYRNVLRFPKNGFVWLCFSTQFAFSCRSLKAVYDRSAKYTHSCTRKYIYNRRLILRACVNRLACLCAAFANHLYTWRICIYSYVCSYEYLQTIYRSSRVDVCVCHSTREHVEQVNGAGMLHIAPLGKLHYQYGSLQYKAAKFKLISSLVYQMLFFAAMS